MEHDLFGKPASTFPDHALNAQHRVFGISEVAEPRPLRALEIFRHAARAERAEQSGNGAVRIDDDEGFAAPRQIASDRPGKADELADVTAIDQLRARDRALDQAGPENERVGASGGLAPQADAAVLGMTLQNVLLRQIEGNRWSPM